MPGTDIPYSLEEDNTLWVIPPDFSSIIQGNKLLLLSDFIFLTCFKNASHISKQISVL